MNTDRGLRLWRQVVGHAHGGQVRVEHVCAALASAARVDGVAVTLALVATPRETMYASDQVAAGLEELTLTLGEGPGQARLSRGFRG